MGLSLPGKSGERSELLPRRGHHRWCTSCGVRAARYSTGMPRALRRAPRGAARLGRYGYQLPTELSLDRIQTKQFRERPNRRARGGRQGAPSVSDQLFAARDNREAIQVEEWEAGPVHRLYLQAGVQQQLAQPLGSEMTTMANVRIERGNGARWDGNDQARPRREASPNVT